MLMRAGRGEGGGVAKGSRESLASQVGAVAHPVQEDMCTAAQICPGKLPGRKFWLFTGPCSVEWVEVQKCPKEVCRTVAVCPLLQPG